MSLHVGFTLRWAAARPSRFLLLSPTYDTTSSTPQAPQNNTVRVNHVFTIRDTPCWQPVLLAVLRFFPRTADVAHRCWTFVLQGSWHDQGKLLHCGLTDVAGESPTLYCMAHGGQLRLDAGRDVPLRLEVPPRVRHVAASPTRPRSCGGRAAPAQPDLQKLLAAGDRAAEHLPAGLGPPRPASASRALRSTSPRGTTRSNHSGPP